MFKHYSSKAAAIKGANRFFGPNHSRMVEEVNGKFGFYMPNEIAQQEEVANATIEAPLPEVHPALTEAGFTVSETGATVPADASKKRTIEKQREERNGVKRPSVGGMCRAVWDFCDATISAEGTIPSAKQVKAQAEVAGWNVNNASIEYYNWRKFMGVRARATTLPEAK